MKKSIGYSENFSFEEAFKVAYEELKKQLNLEEDQVEHVIVTEIGAEMGLNISGRRNRMFVALEKKNFVL
ncbi:MAG: hypothetical protein U0V72_13235 [Cytophagales bacterium]|mgnify:CR=1 FL=1